MIFTTDFRFTQTTTKKIKSRRPSLLSNLLHGWMESSKRTKKPCDSTIGFTHLTQFCCQSISKRDTSFKINKFDKCNRFLFVKTKEFINSIENFLPYHNIRNSCLTIYPAISYSIKYLVYSFYAAKSVNLSSQRKKMPFFS